MTERAHVRYSAVSSREDDWRDPNFAISYSDGHGDGSAAPEDPRYKFQMPEITPWRSILLALFLLSFGSILLIISHLILSEHMGGESSQGYGFLVLGLLIFIPGFYETRIAYYSWRGAKGYKFSRIPAY